jgi:hypothetical protein
MLRQKSPLIDQFRKLSAAGKNPKLTEMFKAMLRRDADTIASKDMPVMRSTTFHIAREPK